MEKEQPHRSSLLVVKIEDEESFGKYACQIRDRFRSTTHTISHRRTGLEILGGGGVDTNSPDLRRRHENL